MSGRDRVAIISQIPVAQMPEIRISLQVVLSGKIKKILRLFPFPRLIIKQLSDGELYIVLHFLHSFRNFMTLLSHPQVKMFPKKLENYQGD